MEIAVHGRRFELSAEVREHAAEKVEHLGKYLHGMERAEVLFSNGKKGHLGDPVTCELMMEGHGHIVRAAGVGPKPDAALEAAADKAAHRLTKLKDRLVARSRPRHKVSKDVLVDQAGIEGDEAEVDIEGIEEL
ncbi:MAG: HPF/RaiA family ribosome-associated protein [Acidimicrobiales bacterium]